MIRIHRLLAALALLALTVLESPAAAAKGIEAGPKGGRLLEKSTPRAEFLLEKDRTVSVFFYNEKLEPVPAGTQVVTVIASPPGGKVQLQFERRGDRLTSRGRMPDGEGYGVVVQLRDRPESRPNHFRFKLETHSCAECRRPEYACTCGH